MDINSLTPLQRSKLIDLAGQRYGKLLVVSLAGFNKRRQSLWVCDCDCGNRITTDGYLMRAGRKRSCGCDRSENISKAQTKDRTGHRYGRLTVLKRAAGSRNGRVYWLCRCDCGNEKEVSGGNLQKGAIRSCGCLAIVKDGRERMPLPQGERAFRALYNSYRISGGRNRGLVFQLTESQFFAVVTQPCHYCGTPPAQVKEHNGDTFTYNGIDRKNNKEGYTIINCLPCCYRCNRAKLTDSYEEFVAWLDTVISFRIKE